MATVSTPYNLRAYQTDVENVEVFHWTVPFDDWVDLTKLDWTLQLDGAGTFDSVNLKQYAKSTARAVQDGNVVKGYEIEIPRRQYDEEQTWYWRVKTDVTLPETYPWTVSYLANKLPAAASPAWTKTHTFGDPPAACGCSVEEIVSGVLQIRVDSRDTHILTYSRDWTASPSTGYVIETQLRVADESRANSFRIEFTDGTYGGALCAGYSVLSYVSEIGTEGTGNDEFNCPEGVAVDDTYIYVVDSNNRRIVKRLKSDLSYVSKIGTLGNGNDQFDCPEGIAVDDTHIYVGDSNNHRIVKRLKSDLSYVSEIGTEGDGNDQFYYPHGVAVDDTYVYVADMYNHRIVKRLKSDLSYVSKIGTFGSGDDQFWYPRGVAVDDTYIYVADPNNHRIVKRLKSDLSYVSEIGADGSGDDQFHFPYSVAVNDAYIYVVDTENDRIVKRLKSDLSYVSEIGSLGSGDDQFNTPFSVAVDDTYTYVADTENDRIVKRLKTGHGVLGLYGLETQLWSVEYEANELPQNATPPWSKIASGTYTEEIIDGKLHIKADNGNKVGWARYPAEMSNTLGTIVESSIKIVKGGDTLELFIADGTYRAYLTFYDDRIETHLGYEVYYMDTTDSYHKYRITLMGTEFKVYVDDVLRMTTAPMSSSFREVAFEKVGTPGDIEAWFDWVYYRAGQVEDSLILIDSDTTINTLDYHRYRTQRLGTQVTVFVDDVAVLAGTVNSSNSDNRIRARAFSDTGVDPTWVDIDYLKYFTEGAEIYGTSETHYVSDWSDVKTFTIRKNLTEEIVDRMWTNIDTHAYAKEARSTNVYALLKSYSQELDELKLESLRTKDGNYLESCRDSYLWDNFGKLIGLPKEPEQPYCEYREMLRQILDAFMFYSAREAGIVQSIKVLTGETPLVIDESDQYGWILDYHYIKDPSHPELLPIIRLMSAMEKGFNFHVYVYNSWGFDLDQDLIAGLVRRLKPAHTVEHIHYPLTQSKSHYFNTYEDWVLCEQSQVDLITKSGSVLLESGQTSGYITTPVLDCSTNLAAYGILEVGEVLDGQGVTYQYSSSWNLVEWSSWQLVEPENVPVMVPLRRYLKVKATLSGSGSYPELQWMKINYKTQLES